MKKITTLLYCFLILMTISCSKEDQNEGSKEEPKDDPYQEKIFIRPVGKYIAEIKGCNYNFFFRRDTVKLIEFDYDANRYLKEIRYYDGRKQNLEYRNEFIYNTAGQVIQINRYDTNNILQIQEYITYQKQKQTLSEVYQIKSDIKTLSEKYEFVTDSIGRIIEVFAYELKDGSLIKNPGSRKFTYDSSGNVKKDFWQGDGYYRITEGNFDTRKNPFFELSVPFSYYAIPYFSIFYTLSNNNTTGYKLTTTFPNQSGVQTSYVTTGYKYEGNYPTVMDNTYFFKYVDLK